MENIGVNLMEITLQLSTISILHCTLLYISIFIIHLSIFLIFTWPQEKFFFYLQKGSEKGFSGREKFLTGF